MLLVHIITAALLLIGNLSLVRALSEEDRLREYEARGYEWPLKEFVPNTPGWRTLLSRRFEQIEETIGTGAGEGRYDAWMQAVASAVVQPNFTENG